MWQYHTLLWYWYLSSKSFWCNYIDLNALFPVLPHSFWSTQNPCHARVAPKVLLLEWLSFLVTSWNQCKKVPNWIRSSPLQWSLTTWTTLHCEMCFKPMSYLDSLFGPGILWLSPQSSVGMANGKRSMASGGRQWPVGMASGNDQWEWPVGVASGSGQWE